MKKILQKNKIEVNNQIILLPYQIEYVQELHHLIINNFDRLQNHFPSLLKHTSTLIMTENYILQKSKNWHKSIEYTYMILFKNELIGHFNIKNINWKNQSAELSYWIDKHAEKKGIVTTIVKYMIQYIFSQTSISKIYARCTIDNKASENIMINSNLKYEGTLYQNYQNLNNLYMDTYLYSIQK